MAITAKKIIVFVLGAIFTITYAMLGGIMVTFGMLVGVIKNGPRKVFSCKVRDVMPACMKNPKLGTHDFIRTKNVRLHYVSAGDHSKPLMLMVHGFPECWYSWRYQITEFKEDYRVVAIDQRGYGESDAPSGVANYTMKLLAEDIKEVVSGLGYKSCILVAHDWGGAVAWNVAATYPEIVDRLIVLNIPHPRNMMDHLQSGFIQQILASWYMFFFQLPFLPELSLWINDYAMIKGAFLSDKMGLKNKANICEEDIEAFKYSASQKGNLSAMLNYYRAAMQRPTRSRSTVDTPTLIIWGDQDRALKQKLLEGTEKYVKNFIIEIIPGASHWVQQDAPDVVNRHIREYLNQN